MIHFNDILIHEFTDYICLQLLVLKGIETIQIGFVGLLKSVLTDININEVKYR